MYSYYVYKDCNFHKSATAIFYSGRQSVQPFSKSAHLQVSRWHGPVNFKYNDDGPPDWTKVNKCFVAVSFVVCLQTLGFLRYTDKPSSHLERFMLQISSLMETTNFLTPLE